MYFFNLSLRLRSERQSLLPSFLIYSSHSRFTRDRGALISLTDDKHYHSRVL